jgi:2-polyprenyl-6-methoxyphenol hydroxylase-like FAD-dependent oxidoreductase
VNLFAGCGIYFDMYDVIVVGTRVAGASTAMLLARRGLSVLAVDRAKFPSDTVSTHQVQVPGGAQLQRWGLLDRVIAAGTPPVRRVRFDPGPVVLSGRLPMLAGVDAVYSPRRTVLDALLVEAAREAGADVRERFGVEELLTADGRITGIRGRGDGGGAVSERAGVVVGADGRHSLVARCVAAAAYRESPPRSVATYTYWSGVPLTGGEIYSRSEQQRMVGVWPTNDGLVMTYAAAPADEFDAVRADPEGSLLRTLDLCGDLGQRVRAGRREHRIVVTPDVPNRVRRPYGPGWALVGDAGLIMDPVTGMGIADALRDAELLADAIATGLDSGPPLETTLAEYHQRRDRAALPMYEFTTDLAAFGPPRPEQQLLLHALAGKPAEVDRFLAMLTGAIPIPEYFGARNLLRVLGLRAMMKAAWAQRRRAA